MLGPAKTHCLMCLSLVGKVLDMNTAPDLPIHAGCRCTSRYLDSIKAGSATKLGENGADYYLKYYGKLPEYYITKQEAKALGWKSYKGNLADVAPGKMIGGNIFYNKPTILPEAPGRIWYECDIDYQGGYRNNFRLVYSNDGLIFKTDSHYLFFIAVE